MGSILVPGTPAPDFRLPGSGGTELSLGQYQGKQSMLLTFYRGQW